MRNIIISPSGKMYGSEQVLIDYLKFTKGRFSVFVCGKDRLYQTAKRDLGYHEIRYFNSVKFLYFKILCLCSIGRVDTVYLNEGGHSRYVSLLSRLVPWVKFIIHVRLIEDTKPERWPRSGKFKNVAVVSISDFLSQMLPVPNLKVYDPYQFRPNLVYQPLKHNGKLVIAVISRISVTKGIDRLIELMGIIDRLGAVESFQFRLYGDVMADVMNSDRYDKLKSFRNVILCGFEPDKNEIYNSVDCVVHASGNEPLGRIFLEAIDYGKPFVGINSGGVGEIGRKLQLGELLVDDDANDDTIGQLLFEKLKIVRENYRNLVNGIIAKKVLAEEIFNPVRYAQAVDSLTLK